VSARVLIIEDNPANLELMTYLLGAFGHTVLTAGDGNRGLETADREHPDVIICDVQLPDIDGFEVARRLKNHPRLRLIPLVAVTALAMVGDRDRVLAAGFDGYFAKPIDPETFVRQVDVFLSTGQHATTPVSPVGVTPPTRDKTPHGDTILVVDNLPVNLDLARSILEPSGYRVLAAGSVAEGLSLARMDGCDLILSDVGMSEESGFDFLLAVKADPQLRAIPFVLITSTMMTDKDRAKGLAMGAARFLRRPLEPEVLLAEIGACLREKGPNQP
jgi:two-component system cell cycle response regulator